MKLQFFVLCTFLFCLFSSFKPEQACEYAGSNMGYVKTETEKAIAMKDLQLLRFHTYKALSAIEKSKKQLKDCGCERAAENIAEGSVHLKQATKATSLAGSRILLNKALEYTIESIEALDNHEKHNSVYAKNKLSLNTTDVENKEGTPAPPSEEIIRKKIDSSLVHYKKSLDKVVSTVDCEDARAYAVRIYEHCEQQLLKPGLSEGKKYYNLKTKEITAKALQRLGACE